MINFSTHICKILVGKGLFKYCYHCIFSSFLKFDVDDVSGELDSNRPVPFRLTPNVYEFISDVGVRGPLTASMISAARCLAHPNFKVQAILR